VVRLSGDDIELEEVERDMISLPPGSLYDYNEGSNNICYFCDKTLMTLFRREWKREGSFYVLTKKTPVFWFCESCYLLFDKNGCVFSGLIRRTEKKNRFFVTCRHQKGNLILLGKKCIQCHSPNCWLPPIKTDIMDDDIIRELRTLFKDQFYVIGKTRTLSQERLI
jgi:hypothetical protein